MVEVGLSAGDGEEEGVEMKVMGEEGEGLLGGDETPQFVEKGEGGFGDVVVGDSPLGEEDDQLLLDGKGGVGMDLEKDGEGQIQGEGDEVEMGKIDFGIELPEIEDSSSLSAPFHSPTSLSFGFVNNKFIFVLIISGFITMGSLLGLERSIIPILAKETYNQGDFGLLLFVSFPLFSFSFSSSSHPLPPSLSLSLSFSFALSLSLSLSPSLQICSSFWVSQSHF